MEPGDGEDRNIAETRWVIAASVEASESVAGGDAAACLPDLGVAFEVGLHAAPPELTATFLRKKRGHVLNLGGEVITGVSRMTAQAVSRGGAGMVTLAAPAQAWSIDATSLTNTIVQGFDGPSDLKALLADSRRNVIAIGPGLGVGSSTREFVLAALATSRLTGLDADALTSFVEAPQDLFRATVGPCLLISHAGEFVRLSHFEGDNLRCNRHAARQRNAVVLFKDPDTVIATPDGRAIINSNVPAHLTTGGSGDVLTGIVGALLAQGRAPFEATAASAWLHGAAAVTFGLGLVAEDLPNALPRVLQKLSLSVQSVDRNADLQAE